MDDNVLVRLLGNILKWAMASAIIGMFTLGVLVMTHWDKTLLRGWHLVPPATSPADCNCKPVADDPPSHRRQVRRRVVRRRVKPVELPVEETAAPEVEQQQRGWTRYEAAPVMATNANLQRGWARYEAAPVTRYNVVVIAPRRHRWPRRFFGAIGRGLGKVIGVR